MREQPMPAEAREPSEMDLVVKSLNNHVDSLNDSLSLLEEKVRILDGVCSRIYSSSYPKNFPPKDTLNNSAKPSAPDRDGLMGDFDKINDRLDTLNKRLSPEFTTSLQVVIDHLQKHI